MKVNPRGLCLIDGWMEFITFVSFSGTVGMRLHNGALSV